MGSVAELASAGAVVDHNSATMQNIVRSFLCFIMIFVPPISMKKHLLQYSILPHEKCMIFIKIFL